MAFHPIVIRPGINVEATPAANEAGWSQSNLIRFREGFIEKLGGWQHFLSTPFIGTVRGLHVWSDLMGNPYAAAGSEQRLALVDGGQLIDVTPIRQTDNVAPSFSTTSGSSTVQVTDAGNGVNAGDWVNIIVPVSVGGLILQGFYLVQTVVDSNNYTIKAASNAASTVSNSGAVPAFATTSGSANVSVTLANHGYSTGSLFPVQVSTTVGGITMLGTYSVQSVTNANTFVIAPGPTASSTATGSENAGNAQIQYLIPSGYASATALTGYGIGAYGAGPYGQASGSTTIAPLRQWFLDNWGQDLVGNYTNGGLYSWSPPLSSNPVAVTITNSPLYNSASFVAMPQQMIVALGAETGGSQDPNLVRWCDAGDFNTWTASSTNQAGSYRIPTGSKIVGGIQGPQFGLIWTDIDLWAMQYVQPPLVFGFSKIGAECGLIAPLAMGIIGQRVIWMSSRSFFMLGPDGVAPLPCPVWDVIYKNLNTTQAYKVFAAVNSLFNEITFFYPSAAGSGEIDSYVKVNVAENFAWDYGSLVRTAWADESALGPPLGVDASGLLQQHDTPGVYDADGSAMDSWAQTGYFALADQQGGKGSDFVFVERIIPDFIWAPYPGGTIPATASLQMTLQAVDYLGDTPRTYGPQTITPTTDYAIFRARGRLASLKIESTSIGTFWRLGRPLHNGSPAGRR